MPKGDRKVAHETSRLRLTKMHGMGVALIVLAFAVLFVWFNGFPGTQPAVTPTPPVVTPSATFPTVRLVKITTNDCTDCFDAELMTDAVKRTGMKISSEESVDYRSSEGQTLIQTHAIEGVPTLLVFVKAGDAAVAKEISSFMENKGGGVYAFDRLIPIYYDTQAQKIVGRITATFIDDPRCLKCVALSLAPIETAGIKIYRKNRVDYDSQPGRELIEKFKITRVPSLILSSDYEAYENLRIELLKIGTEAEDGTYIFRDYNPPFRNLETDEIEGYVSFIYIDDMDCPGCYEPETHRRAMENRGVNPVSESVYDVNSIIGKEYIEKYGIDKIPTAIISPEIGTYPSVATILEQIFSEEKDGWFVFRKFDALPTANYRDLETGEIVIHNDTMSELVIPVGPDGEILIE